MCGIKENNLCTKKKLSDLEQKNSQSLVRIIQNMYKEKENLKNYKPRTL